MDWKWIDGYENDYKICENGDVISCRFNKEKILKPRNDTNGYLFVTLYKNKKQKNFTIHRLIALHFIENPNNYQIVDHINGNKRDNSIVNLRWITLSGNNRNTKNRGKHMKGVYFDQKNHKKFIARITIGNERKYLGYFDTELEAHEAYMKEYNEIMDKFNKM